MTRTNFNYPAHLLMLVVLLLIFVANTLQLSTPITTGLSYIFTPTFYYATSTGDSVRRSVKSLNQIGKLRSENSDLKLENASLEASNAIIKLLLEENSALATQLRLGAADRQVVEVEVMSNSALVGNSLIINKGSEHGIEKGDIFHLGNAYLGTVREVTGRSSEVVLPSSRSSSLQVIIVDPGAEELNLDKMKESFASSPPSIIKGVAIGNGTEVVIENIGNDSNITDGMAVLVNDSRVGEFFYLGTIGSILSDPSASTKSASVNVAVNHKDLNYAFVLLR